MSNFIEVTVVDYVPNYNVILNIDTIESVRESHFNDMTKSQIVMLDDTIIHVSNSYNQIKEFLFK